MGYGMGYGMGFGHGWALGAIVALVISTAFLVWLGGKEGSPYQKFGKFIAWVAVILTGLMVIGSLIMCISAVSKGWLPPCLRGHAMMQQMMEQGQRPPAPGGRMPGMGPGMRMMPMPTPQAPEEKK